MINRIIIFLAAALILPAAAVLPQGKKTKEPAKAAVPSIQELVLAGKIAEAVKLAAKQPLAAESALNSLMAVSDTQITLRKIPEAKTYLEVARKFLGECQKTGVAKNLPEEALKGRELRLEGIVLSDNGEFEKAEAYLRQALEISKKVKDPALEAGIHNNLGYALRNMNLVDEAVQEFDSARKLAEEQKDDLRAGSYNYNLGEALQSSRRLEQALAAFQRSAEQNKAAARPDIEARAIRMQGMVTGGLDPRSPEAFTLLEDAASKFAKLADSREEGRTYLFIADHIAYSMDFPRALQFGEKALPLLTQAKDTVGLQRCYEFLSDMYGRTGDIAKCEKYKKLAEEIAIKK